MWNLCMLIASKVHAIKDFKFIFYYNQEKVFFKFFIVFHWLSLLMIVSKFPLTSTYPVDWTNQLNIVQSLNQLWLLDDIHNAIDFQRNASVAHCIKNIVLALMWKCVKKLMVCECLSD